MPETDLKERTQTRSHLPGFTSISNKALLSIAQAATSNTLRIGHDDISVSTFDDQGKLGFKIVTSLRADDVQRSSLRTDSSLFALLEQARETIKEQMHRVSGHTIGRVDIFIGGIARINDERKEIR